MPLRAYSPIDLRLDRTGNLVKVAIEMPALMTADDAARATLDGIAAGDFEIHYPKKFTHWLKLLRTLPYAQQFAAVRKVTKL